MIALIGTSIVLLGTILLIIFLLWQARKFRKPVPSAPTPETKPTTPSKPWWGGRQQSVFVGLLLAGLVCVIFPNQVKELLSKAPIMAAAIIMAIAILSIKGNSESFIKWAHRIALPILLILLGYYVLYPAVEKQVTKAEEPKKTETAKTPKPSPPAPAPKPEQKIVPLSFGEHVLTLKGFGDNDWVPDQPLYFPARARLFYKGPSSSQFRLEATGFIDLISNGCKDGRLLQKGVKFRGQKGEKMIIRILPENS